MHNYLRRIYLGLEAWMPMRTEEYRSLTFTTPTDNGELTHIGS